MRIGLRAGWAAELQRCDGGALRAGGDGIVERRTHGAVGNDLCPDKNPEGDGQAAEPGGITRPPRRRSEATPASGKTRQAAKVASHAQGASSGIGKSRPNAGPTIMAMPLKCRRRRQSVRGRNAIAA